MDAATKAAVNAAAARASEAAVKKTLLTLGIDATSPHEVREFQLDIIHLRNSRLAVGGRGKYWFAVFSTLMALLGAVLSFAAQKLLGSFLPW